MRGLRYDPSTTNYQGLLTSEAMGQVVETYAADAAAFAASISPVRTGTYRESWGSDLTVMDEPGGSPRQTGIVANTTEYAAVVEMRHHVAARAADWVESQ